MSKSIDIGTLYELKDGILTLASPPGADIGGGECSLPLTFELLYNGSPRSILGLGRKI